MLKILVLARSCTEGWREWKKSVGRRAAENSDCQGLFYGFRICDFG